ncbi:probably inactive leucine-rich repeat receptor-like protein kinase At5g48380 [Miscanthus floridulus]|uniref:probably inactive leucine-rich repeat receptor-like protein kinase At5g48380 n=1 Tax=Miscanthus floridulus TaxID=154761 RepID=UPI0034576F1D
MLLATQLVPISHPMKNSVILLLLLCISSCAGGSDVQCLKGLKESLGDPNGALSWMFSNNVLEDCIYGFSFSPANRPIECWNDGRIMSLNLSGMELQGSFPRGLQFCRSMTGLDLSGNDFTGPLPADIDQQLPFVTSLDLSSNGFSGEIPRGIGNMTYLNTVNLQHNRFTGQIPDPMGDLARLVSLNVADNSLSGPIPGSLQRFSAEDFAGNDGLCGAPLGKCKRARIHLRLRRVNDASSIGGAVGFVAGFVVAFYFPQWFVFCGSLRPYIFPVCS